MALTKIQELEAAYKRQLAGSASDTDKANLAYATSKGIWKAPVESGSLKGTNTAERTLPASQSPITDFKSALKEATRIAYGNKPTSAILSPYSDAGMPITNPSLINYAIQGDTEQRAGRLTDLYNNTMDMIKEQEATRQQASKYGQDILANMMKTSFAKSITGADYESIMRGEMPTELITAWGEYLQTAEAKENKPTPTEILNAKKAGFDFDDKGNLIPSEGNVFEIPDVGTKGGQCGSYLYGLMGETAHFGDTFEEKATKINKPLDQTISAPQIGDILVFKTKLPYGHVAAITAVNGNMVTVTESNWNMDEKVGTRTFDITQVPNLQGAVTGGTFKSSGEDYFADFANTLAEPQKAEFNKLNDTMKSNIKQLVSGEVLLSDLMASRGIEGSKARQEILAAAQRVDPGFSENVNKIRFEFTKKWQASDSVIGKNKNAINTALGHLAEVKEMTMELSPDDLQEINKLKNWWSAETGNAAITNLQFGLTQLATEIAAVYKGTGAAPSEQEINDQKKLLGLQFSKSQFKGILNTTAKFLSSKITAARYLYKSTMGKEYNQTIIDPDKKQALIDAGIDPKSIVTENIPAPKKQVSYSDFEEDTYEDIIKKTPSGASGSW